MITTLKLIVSYDVLGLKKFFRAFVLVMHFKGCEYAAIEENFFVKTYDMCQSKLPKDMCRNHNLAKKYGNGRQEWEKACVNSSFPPTKLNIPVKTRHLYIFLNFFVFTLFFQFLLYMVELFFTFNFLFIMHLTFSFVDLPIKLSFFRKLCNSKKHLYYVTTCRIL